MAVYSARPGYCERCGAEIAPIDWQTQQRGVACDDCEEREKMHDRLASVGLRPLNTEDEDARPPGAVGGEAAKTRYSVGEVVTLALCAVPLATAALGFGYVFVDDVLKIIGGRR